MTAEVAGWLFVIFFSAFAFWFLGFQSGQTKAEKKFIEDWDPNPGPGLPTEHKPPMLERAAAPVIDITAKLKRRKAS